MSEKSDLGLLVKYWDKENFVSASRPHYCDFASQVIFEEEVGDFKNKSVLDVGCGQGRMLEYFIERGAVARGVDISRKNLLYIRSKGLDAIEGDARRLPFADNSFDIVFSIGVVEHFADTSLAVREHVQVCKKGGIIIIIVPNIITPYFATGVLFHILRGSIRHGLVLTAGKSYTKAQVKRLLMNNGCKDIRVIPYYGSAFLKFVTTRFNKKLAASVEASYFSKKFGHLLFGIGYKK